MESENLNIDNKVKQLVLKALNKFKNNAKAAEALKIHERTLIKYISRFDIYCCPNTKEYSFNEPKKIIRHA